MFNISNFALLVNLSFLDLILEIVSLYYVHLLGDFLFYFHDLYNDDRDDDDDVNDDDDIYNDVYINYGGGDIYHTLCPKQTASPQLNYFLFCVSVGLEKF